MKKAKVAGPGGASAEKEATVGHVTAPPPTAADTEETSVGGGTAPSAAAGEVITQPSPTTKTAIDAGIAPPSAPAAATPAADDLVPGSSLTGSQILSMDADPNIKLSAQKSQNIVKFDSALDTNQNLVNVEEYVAKFLKESQPVEFHDHPGLMCSIYEARIIDLILGNYFDDARAVFNEKVQPLDELKNVLYAPCDLPECVEKLKRFVETRKVPEETEREDLKMVIFDYMALYFPESVELSRAGTVYDFLSPFRDEKGRRYRCRACQWVIPTSGKVGPVVGHIEHKDRVKHCPRVTKWMSDQLASMKSGTSGADSGTSIPSSSQKLPPRKRRALSPPAIEDVDPDDIDPNETVLVPVGPMITTFGHLSTTNLSVLDALGSFSTKAALRANDIVKKQDSIILGLRNLVVNAIGDKSSLDHSVFLKVKSLLDLADELLPLYKFLPTVTKLLVKQSDLLSELRRHFLVVCSEAALRNVSLGTSDAQSRTSSTGASAADLGCW